MKYGFLMIFSIFAVSFISAQKASNLECTVKCTVDAITESVNKTHYIYTGSDTTGLNVTMTTITIMDARKELVKKRKDKNCISDNPEDCMIEVLEEIPAVTMNLYTLPNTDKTKEYDIRIEKMTVVKREAGLVDEAVVCPKNRTSNLIKKVQAELKKLGYPVASNGILDQSTNLAMVDFQRSNQLPYGDLTLSTLAALNIK